MAVRKTAPPANYATQADTVHVIAEAAAAGADTDLLGVAGKPKCAPQLVELHNTHATDAGAIILTPEKGVDITITLVAGAKQKIRHPIKKIEDTGTTGGTMQVICHWWYRGVDWNPEA